MAHSTTWVWSHAGGRVSYVFKFVLWIFRDISFTKCLQSGGFLTPPSCVNNTAVSRGMCLGGIRLILLYLWALEGSFQGQTGAEARQ